MGRDTGSYAEDGFGVASLSCTLESVFKYTLGRVGGDRNACYSGSIRILTEACFAKGRQREVVPRSDPPSIKVLW